MLSRLKQLVDEVARLLSKLILLIGPPGCGKTALLAGLGDQTHVSVMNLGLELGTRLAKLPQQTTPTPGRSPPARDRG
jgi:SpoVK/Ycf46/Vps4 family AAA+-type ATPase